MNLKIEYRSVSSLHEYAANARTHSPAQVDQIAGSIREFGFNNPVLVDKNGEIIAGHGRVLAARQLGLTQVPTISLGHLSQRQKQAYVLADNKIALNAGWDFEKLAEELSQLADSDFDLSLTGFDEHELDALLKGDASILPDDFEQPQTVQVGSYERTTGGKSEQMEEPDDTQAPVTLSGDLWLLGEHRLLCGDSTSAQDVARLMAGDIATLVHADPPYGMGKESNGVANDNLYRERLDAFQMAWWNAFRPHMKDNASVYIWGNAADLWRLWYVGGLGTSELIELRNEIVWDKKAIAGMASPDLTQFPIATERCLFMQIGKQFLGNINQDDYWEGWEPVRVPLLEAANRAGLTPSRVHEITGVQMYSHSFSRSQWTFIPEKHYRALQDAYPDHFVESYRDMRKRFEKIKKEWQEYISGVRDGFRSYFDNAHDIMRDVWEFPRVVGEERYGHATPKPVAMIDRCVKSSSRAGDIVVEPFGGSGPTMISCELLERRCRMMELVPTWCDVIVRRWQKFTGKEAIHAETGKTFEQIKRERE